MHEQKTGALLAEQTACGEARAKGLEGGLMWCEGKGLAQGLTADVCQTLKQNLTG